MPSASYDYYPAPFPHDVPVVDLPKLSLESILQGDEDTAETLYQVCTNEGFYYIDLTTHPLGLKFLEEGQQLHHVGRDFFNHSMETKKSFKHVPEYGHIDSGYHCAGADEEGKAKTLEFFSISRDGLLLDRNNYTLPSSLSNDEELYKSFFKNANIIALAILSIFEKKLHLVPGALTDLHQTKDWSGCFIRFLHYPAPKNGKLFDKVPGPSHTDAGSITMLFNWQGGLQITKTGDFDGKYSEDADKKTDNWVYVRPEPGHLIVNLGEAMAILTNGKLKAGKHRVVTPPGPQGNYPRFSVIATNRPANNTIMKSLKSDVIPPETEEQLSETQIDALQWSINKVSAIVNRAASD